ncbi:hypothetical protein [Sphingobacterium sp.]|uniref:hypothetical protein n=1 Tax=Sphingobacterium sp. TaxID=341027 RepID=UPI0028AD77FE|nr:hypothetical protein [Sphingobacterium sp.]
MKKHQILEAVGKALFYRAFPLTKNVFEPKDIYTKYDLLVGGNKYIEIKCNSDIANPYADNMITNADWEWLLTQTPEDSKALYVLFDDDWTFVYDLKEVHRLGYYYYGYCEIFEDEMEQKNPRKTKMAYLKISDCVKNGVLKMFPKQGSIKLLGIKITDINRRFKNGTADQQFINEILEVIKK